MAIELFEQAAEATPGTSLEDFETWLGLLLESQRDVLWQIGDLALAVERQHPTTFYQAFPEWISPGLIDRCKAVAAAYRPEDRNILATWSVHMKHAKDPARNALVQAAVDAGQTSDENRKNPAPVPEPVKEPEPVAAAPPAAPERTKWLLAVDVSYYVCSTFFSGAGVEAASTVEGWLVRLIDRLYATKGLTDVVCCLDSPNSFRKDLTKDWEHPYKLRVAKEDELREQLNLAKELLTKRNLLCVSIDGMEADDVMASYATQFNGRVTLLTKDKDMRQSLSAKCNMLTDVTWEENSETGKQMPIYKWVTAASHFNDGCPYQSGQVSGISPEAWPHFQAIAGDTGDNVKGAIGIGPKVAMELIKEHGTVKNVIAACKDGNADLTEKKRLAVLDFEAVSNVTLQLVTMIDTLPVPKVTTICMKGEL